MQPNTGLMPRAWPSMRLNLRPLLAPKTAVLLPALTPAFRRRTLVKRPCKAVCRALTTHSRTLLSTTVTLHRGRASPQTESSKTVAELRCQASRALAAPWQITRIRSSTMLSRSQIRESKTSHSLATASPGKLRTRSSLTSSRIGSHREAPRV